MEVMVVSGNDEPTPEMIERMVDLAHDAAEPLDPELVPWVEEGEWGTMLRHPLVYMVPLVLPGTANKMLRRKQEMIAEAEAEKDWHQAIFLRERPYRLGAFIDYCVGRDEYDEPMPLSSADPHYWDIACDVWVDSENISQNLSDWRALVCNGEGLCLGTAKERQAFYNLPDPIPAWRGGTVGDWSWTTDDRIAAFFSRQSGVPVRFALIPKADCFGYLTRRGESELLVKITDERRPLVYPNGEPES